MFRESLPLVRHQLLGAVVLVRSGEPLDLWVRLPSVSQVPGEGLSTLYDQVGHPVADDERLDEPRLAGDHPGWLARLALPGLVIGAHPELVRLVGHDVGDPGGGGVRSLGEVAPRPGLAELLPALHDVLGDGGATVGGGSLPLEVDIARVPVGRLQVQRRPRDAWGGKRESGLTHDFT